MANRNTYSSASTPPTSGNDYMDQTSDHIKVMYDAVSLPLTSVSGTNTVVGTVDPSFDGDGLVNGMRFGVTWAVTNTGTVTLNINGVGAVAVVDKAGDALIAGALVAGTRDTIEVVSGVFRLTTAGAGGGGIDAILDTQIFAASGTWTKPAEGAWAHIKVWGAGGSGGKGQSTDMGGGGGGGAFNEYIVPLSTLSATESVTIGAGGAAQTSSITNGNDGASSDFATFARANGGRGGTASATNNNAGGDGGDASSEVQNNAGAQGDNGAGNHGHNGGGAGGAGDSYPHAGGNSYNGGGGGGGAESSGTAGAGGTSTNGGDGGAGSVNTVTATSGTQPSGGGGGSEEGTSGAGADGKVTVEVY